MASAVSALKPLLVILGGSLGLNIGSIKNLAEDEAKKLVADAVEGKMTAVAPKSAKHMDDNNKGLPPSPLTDAQAEKFVHTALFRLWEDAFTHHGTPADLIRDAFDDLVDVTAKAQLQGKTTVEGVLIVAHCQADAIRNFALPF